MLRSIWYKFAHICTVAQSIAQLCSCSAADRRLYLLLLHKCSLEHLHSCSLAQTIAQLWSCSTAQTIAQLCSCSGADRGLYLVLLHRSISISEQAGAPHWPTSNPIQCCFMSTILFRALLWGVPEGTLILRSSSLALRQCHDTLL